MTLQTHKFRVFLSVIAIPSLWMFMTTSISVVLVKILWDNTIPFLFPGGVEEGLIAGSISVWTAIKLSLLTALLTGGLLKAGFNGSIDRAQGADDMSYPKR
jgi:hypothetical protein